MLPFKASESLLNSCRTFTWQKLIAVRAVRGMAAIGVAAMPLALRSRMLYHLPHRRQVLSSAVD